MAGERIEGWTEDGHGWWCDGDLYVRINGDALEVAPDLSYAVPLPVLAALLRARGFLVLSCPPDLAARIAGPPRCWGSPPRTSCWGRSA
jgi:hypothetical protein